MTRRESRLTELASPASCLHCRARRGRIFCNFARRALPSFDKIASLRRMPDGESLLVEGLPVSGVWVVCSGQVRVISFEGRRSGSPAIQFLGRGQAIGLAEALHSVPARANAVTLGDCELRFIPSPLLRRFLDRDIDACLWAAHFV
jgi:CRP-like cAMP-binding protein